MPRVSKRYNPFDRRGRHTITLDSADIRESFLRFFEERGHKRLPSWPLVPPGEPPVTQGGLLFTTAGMHQFKRAFAGQEKAPHPRLTTVQKCFRTSDIDAVGDTAHLTFFEMLGNFSVGDYFKADAIPWAWELLTAPRPQGMALDRSRLWATIYLDDDEAFELWRKVGIPAQRIVRFDESENYWFSGPVGPCGPNSEIYYDFGRDQGCRASDCAPPLHTPPDCSRFLELWNLVFMTLYQDEKGKRTPLPARNIDTGAGLERWPVPILWQDSIDWQGKPKRWTGPPSVYDTDLFGPVIQRIEELSAKRYGEDPQTDRAMRIVAEHARAVTFLIGDERTPVLPSNEERGYVARRIIRRAVYFGRRYLGLEEPFLGDVSETVIGAMAGAYPELERQRGFVLEVIGPEERRFEETLSRGLEILNQLITSHEEAG
ncbi:MAG TPA: alanine--tRNA ligase-related protein, partial [Dehalococcoidia bacterium]|nr:alanine--tRNA ligase-related protein [Dehalococcoidia bacterium]